MKYLETIKYFEVFNTGVFDTSVSIILNFVGIR